MAEIKTKNSKVSNLWIVSTILIINALSTTSFGAGADRRSDDIILAKGKLIMLGGKGKGKFAPTNQSSVYHQTKLYISPPTD